MKTFKKITSASCVVALGLSLSSCELISSKQAKLMLIDPVANSGEPTVKITNAVDNKAALAELKPKAELYPGSDRSIPLAPVQHRQTEGKVGSYNLNFDDADLGEVAKVVLSDILSLNYVLNPKVVGKVTLQTTQPLSKDELLPTLEMVLRMNNAALVKDGKIYHIEPISEALFTSEISTHSNQAGYQTRIIPIRNVAAQEIVDVIKPLVQEKTVLHVDNIRNILIASGTPDEMMRILDLVSTFDIDVLKGQSFGLFTLAHTEPDTIIKELQEIFNNKKKSEEDDFFRFIPIERMNAVMAITHQAKYLQDIESWIFRLDKAQSGVGGGVNVYKVQHADAEELANTLNEIFTGAQKSDSSGQVAAGKKSTELTNKSSTDSKADTKSTSTSGASTKRSVKRSSRSGTGTATVANVDDVRIISDKANNALIIVATPREYDVILPVIRQLDLLPLQVLIDATIVSVDLKDDLKYGIQWKLQHDNSLLGNGLGATSLGSVTADSAAAFTTGGLSAVYNSGAVNALLASQANKDNVNVISSPSLMVLNNQEATIEVGTQIPTLASTLSGAGITSSGTGSTGLVTNSQIEYKDTGVKLQVTPRVNANGMVIMVIKQSVSDPVESTIGVTSSAAIAKKEIESSVAIHDGETIVLGGLIKENNTYNKSGMPWLHELPWVGSLFGNTTNNKDKSELVVLITPRVVKSKQDSRLISNEFKRKLTGIYHE